MWKPRSGRGGQGRWTIGWFIAGLAAVGVTVISIIAIAAGPSARHGSPESRTPSASGTSGTPEAQPVAFTTTADGDERLRQIDVQSAPAGDEVVSSIRVDSSATAQEIGGFGAALTHASAAVLAAMPNAARAELIDELFSPEGPVRLTVLRVPIGASDFVDRDAFTFDDLPPGESDWSLDRFDLGPDREAMIPVLQEVLAVAPDVRVIASPWSPPAWLKTSGSLEGGRLLDEDRAYDTYAAYLVRFVESYRDAGVDVDLLTVQNEPQLRHPDGYPGTDMPVWQQARLIERLGPALVDAGLDTGILGYDHNWELNPADAASTPEGEDPAYEYPADLLRTAAAQWIDGIAYHCYSGNAAAQSWLWEQFRDIQIWLTECSGSSAPGDSPEQAFADTFSWQSANLLIGALQHRATGVLTWNLALNEQYGPHRGGCETCSGVVTIGDDGTVTRNAEYYVLAHAAAAVPPGSVLVVTSTDEPDVSPVGFRTPDGALVVIVWNGAEDPRTVRLGGSLRDLVIELPGRSLTTVTDEVPCAERANAGCQPFP